MNNLKIKLIKTIKNKQKQMFNLYFQMTNIYCLIKLET